MLDEPTYTRTQIKVRDAILEKPGIMLAQLYAMGIPPRTIRAAIKYLTEKGELERRYSLRDARIPHFFHATQLHAATPAKLQGQGYLRGRGNFGGNAIKKGAQA